MHQPRGAKMKIEKSMSLDAEHLSAEKGKSIAWKSALPFHIKSWFQNERTRLTQISNESKVLCVRIGSQILKIVRPARGQNTRHLARNPVGASKRDWS